MSPSSRQGAGNAARKLAEATGLVFEVPTSLAGTRLGCLDLNSGCRTLPGVSNLPAHWNQRVRPRSRHLFAAENAAPRWLWHATATLRAHPIEPGTERRGATVGCGHANAL